MSRVEKHNVKVILQHKPNRPVCHNSSQEIDTEIEQQRHIIFPIAGAETDRQATGRIERCVHKTEASDYTCFSSHFVEKMTLQTQAIKTQLHAAANQTQFLRLRKSRALEASGTEC